MAIRIEETNNSLLKFHSQTISSTKTVKLGIIFIVEVYSKDTSHNCGKGLSWMAIRSATVEESSEPADFI